MSTLESPPAMTASNSKSSSFHSFTSDEHTTLSDTSHFEDIGLGDEDHVPSRTREVDNKHLASRFTASYSSDLRAAAQQHKVPRPPSSRESSRNRSQRDITPKLPARPAFPTLQTYPRATDVRSTSTNALLAEPLGLRGFGGRSPSAHSLRRQRTPSPNLSLVAKDPNILAKPRRRSWQSSRERKSATQLELECDEDEGDDIPEGIVLDNVPLSPRPPSERSFSQPSSKATSPDRAPKARVRSVGNGTPAVAAAQGSLRSPSWKSDAASQASQASQSNSFTSANSAPSPLKSRAKSWTSAHSELSADARALTEKLEEYADEVEHKSQRSSTGSMPLARRSSDVSENKARHKSALAELPPLRRTNIMIDPLPISKEKEAVLSRTRPSWLPPKDPAEEKRHLKEYQKMMAHSLEAERRREAEKRSKSECRDTAADSLMQIWEIEVLPRWNDAIRERRTRELWWRGVAPRSRGAVWTRAIGNELGLTTTSYEAALGRARQAEQRSKDDAGLPEDAKYLAWFQAIRRDVEEKTWKDLKIFQSGAPLHDSLVDVLSAYSMYRNDIGYISGCNTIAALLLLNLPNPATAFVALANILNRPLPLSFLVGDAGAKSSAYNLMLQTLGHKTPQLHSHLTHLPDHDPDFYMTDIFTSLFTTSLALDQAARLWDVYMFEGDAVLVRAGVALITLKEMVLLGCQTMAEVKSVLEPTRAQGSEAPIVLAEKSEEERWMRAVREAGKV